MVWMNRKLRKEKLIKMVTLFYKKINELNNSIVLELIVSLFETSLLIWRDEIINFFDISLSRFFSINLPKMLSCNFPQTI
jgi:hypothetical protein